MSSESKVVSASRDVGVPPDVLFELIADPSRQPEWDGNDNLTSSSSARIRAAGEVFVTVLTRDASVRENHVVEFEEGRRIAWRPSEVGRAQPGHLWRWELEPTEDGTRVTHTYDWTQLTDESRMGTARAMTPDKLRASMDRLAALAEGG